MIYEIELTTMNDVQEFNKIVTQVEGKKREENPTYQTAILRPSEARSRRQGR